MRNFVRGVVAVAFVGSMALGFGCSGKPSKGDCEKAMSHAMELMMGGKDMSDDMKKAMKASMESEEGKKTMAEGVDKCVKEMKKSDIDCVLGAKDTEALMKCDSGKKK